ncbi:MAG TPA: hypothetical protein VEL06_10680, partial [Haliangiales bacterium]|nr:hypothetical protein [Haliangiales bacterium]
DFQQTIYYSCDVFAVQTNAALTRLFPTIGFQIITELCSPEDFPCRGIDKLSNSWAKHGLSPGNSNPYFQKSFLNPGGR